MPARKKDTRVSPSNKWTGTLNNWTEAEYKFIVDQLDTMDDVEWVIGKEICPTTDTPHLQMCFRRTSISRVTGKPIKWRPLPLLKVGNGRIHFERMRLSWLTNCEYCAKDGDYRTSSGLDIEAMKVRAMTQFELMSELGERKRLSKEADERQWIEAGRPSYDERILPPAEPEHGLYCLVEEELARRTALRPTRDDFIPEGVFTITDDALWQRATGALTEPSVLNRTA